VNYDFTLFHLTSNLGTFGNNWKEHPFQVLHRTPMSLWKRMRVDVECGFHGGMSQLLLCDFRRDANVVQNGSVDVAQLMPRHTLSSRSFRSRLQHALQ